MALTYIHMPNPKQHTIPKNLLRQVGRAISDFQMINDHDRILLALSGGKDSLSLLHILRHFQRCAPITFDLAAITLNPMIESFDPSPLKDYLKKFNIKYFYVEEHMEELAKSHMNNNSFCAFCSRIKRGIIYRIARTHGYNLIAMGQHLDDLAESFLMSAFHGGQIRTMKAHYLNDAQDLRIIRPMVYVREHQIADYAAQSKLPVIQDSCPACFAMPTQRQHMKQLLQKEEKSNIQLYRSLLSTLKPVMSTGCDKAILHAENNKQAKAG